MHLLRKVRTLVGALVHETFAPRPEEAQPKSVPPSSVPESTRDMGHNRSALEPQNDQAPETERVADLITQQKEAGDQE